MVFARIGIGPFDAAWLAATVALTTPILLAAVGELISERAGVLNVGLEGMMLSGAFFSFLVAWSTGSLVVGVLAGIGGGLLFGVIMSLLAVEAQADQIVSGVGINLAAIGLTTFLFDEIFGERPQVVLDRIGDISLPFLSDLPGGVGPALFKHDPLVYLGFLLVPAAWFLLYKTKWGLSIRAAGEMPAAADTAGVSVRRVRWSSILLASALAGLAGAFLALATVGIFSQEMTAGRGFLALVVVIFGRWHPLGLLGAALVLGGADALQLRLAARETVPQEVWGVGAAFAAAFVIHRVLVRRQGRPWPVAVPLAALVALCGVVLFVATPEVQPPVQVWRALPFLLALVVLGGAVAQARMPSKLTLPYRRGE